MKKVDNVVPQYIGLRIYLAAFAIYYLLIIPITGVIMMRNLNDWDKMLKNNRSLQAGALKVKPESFPDDTLKLAKDTLGRIIARQAGNGVPKKDTTAHAVVTFSIGNEKNNDMNFSDKFENVMSLVATILILVLGFAFNYPFKRYFRRKRKGKVISPRLHAFCKKYLLKVPLYNSYILLTLFGTSNVYSALRILIINNFNSEFERSFYIQLFFVSIVASVLLIMFVYYWFKHRVHLLYIEHIYSEEELKARIFGKKRSTIKERLRVSSIMTTFLPLIIVLSYLFYSLTSLSSFSAISHEQAKILLGDYYHSLDFYKMESFNSLKWMHYVNAMNTTMMLVGIISGIIVSFIYIVLFVKWTTLDLVQPLSELLAKMKRTGEGDLNQFAIVRTNDEIGELTEGYNDMTIKLNNYISNITTLNVANERFVPRQFLEFLEKESIVDVNLGDQVQREMTVLFADIRAFTVMSERMTPKENFDFINDYLGHMEPIISRNNGFIDKYIGDAIMALFPHSPDDAVQAAIGMQKQMVFFNRHNKQEKTGKVEIGIGIHTGMLMVGIVGGSNRLQGTVISDAVNLASRIEGLTKNYNASIIITGDTQSKMLHPELFAMRSVDVVKVVGKCELVTLFEILEGVPDSLLELKKSQKDEFEQGNILYKAKQFAQSLSIIEKLLESNPEDRLLQIYQLRCKTILQEGCPPDWDGVEVFRQK